VLPGDLPPELARIAEATAAAAIVTLGATYGCFHTEMKFTSEGPRIIEVNGRIGGGIPEMVELAGGNESILRLGMDLALGVPRDVRPRYSRIGWWRAITPPVSANRIEAITGLETLKHLPGVDQVIVNRGAGEAVDWRQGYRDFVVQVYGSGADYEEVERQCASVDRAISVTYGDAVAVSVPVSVGGGGGGGDATRSSESAGDTDHPA
jgi:biotin carboxylase